MKRTTTGTLGMILVLMTATFLSSGIAMAQDFGPRGERSPLTRQRFLENLPGMTEEQLSQISALGEEFKAASGFLREERKILHDQLEAALQSANPDAITVGQLVISQRDLREQRRSAQEDFRATFQSLLTLEQQEALEEMRNRRRRGRRGLGRRSGDFSNDGF